jgi:hypothetical protein
MSNFFQKMTEDSRSIGLALFVSYAIGFLTWNFYLAQFGFFEYDFLQTRFLSTGLLTVIFVFLPFVILIRPLRKNAPENRSLKMKLAEYFIIFLLANWYFFFVLVLFPNIPQFFGGAYPFVKSIVADPTEIAFLQDLDIPSSPNAEGKSSIQTNYVCEIYSNREVIILATMGREGNSMRALMLQKTDFKGSQAIPPLAVDSAINLLCRPFIMNSEDFFSNFLPKSFSLHF